jgi:hypothetical protein
VSQREFQKRLRVLYDSGGGLIVRLMVASFDFETFIQMCKDFDEDFDSGDSKGEAKGSDDDYYDSKGAK